MSGRPIKRTLRGRTRPPASFFTAGAARRRGGVKLGVKHPPREGGALPSEIIPAGRLRRSPAGAHRRPPGVAVHAGVHGVLSR